MKTHKLNLAELKIDSFVTEITKKENQTIEGGTDTRLIERILSPLFSMKPDRTQPPVQPPSQSKVAPRITGPSYGQTFCGGWQCFIIGQ